MGAHFLHCSLLPGDSLRPTKGGAQSGYWVQGPRAPLTCGFGQVSAQASHYLLLTRACDERTIFIPNLQQREPRPGEGKLLTRGHTRVTEQQVLPESQSLNPRCLPPSPGSPSPGFHLPSPTPYPGLYQTATGFMAPGAMYLLPHHYNWPPPPGAKACWWG